MYDLYTIFENPLYILGKELDSNEHKKFGKISSSISQAPCYTQILFSQVVCGEKFSNIEF